MNLNTRIKSYERYQSKVLPKYTGIKRLLGDLFQ